MKIKNLSKSFSNKEIIKDFSLEIPKSSIACLIGPSGCGKTTLLNIIAGLEKSDSGEVTDVGRVSYLFQDPRLLPWKTVLENVDLAVQDTQKAKAYLKAVGLENDLDKFPYELSGGMKQRVAIARAFAFESDAILMDEPFQNLDIELKSSLLKTFLDMWQNDKRTVLWVTHDVSEACLVANNIVCVGTKPMVIKATFINPMPQKDRTVSNISKLQSEILQKLL